MPEFKNKEEYEKWKAEKIQQRLTTESIKIKAELPKDTRENEDNKNNKRKQSSVMKKKLLLLVAIPSLSLIAIIIFVLLSSPNVSGLWTARAELVDAFKSLMKEPLDEKDKLPLDIELVLKHESRKIISGKFTLKHFSDANLDVPIEINGKIGNIIGIRGNDKFKHLNIGDIPVEFTGRNNMNLFEIEVSFDGEVKSEKLVGSLSVSITGKGEYWHRYFRGDIEFKKY